jgi:hypothetical protein
MDCNATELLADYLTLPRVDARANVNAEFLDRVYNCPSAANRTRGTIKSRQEAIAGSIDLTTTMPCELFTNKGMMLGEQVFPSSITDFDKPSCRFDNVCEEYRRQYAVTLSFNLSATASQERFNLTKD